MARLLYDSPKCIFVTKHFKKGVREIARMIFITGFYFKFFNCVSRTLIPCMLESKAEGCHSDPSPEVLSRRLFLLSCMLCPTLPTDLQAFPLAFFLFPAASCFIIEGRIQTHPGNTLLVLHGLFTTVFLLFFSSTTDA